jgi:hypothetical protein
MDEHRREELRKRVTIASMSAIAGGLAWWVVLASVFGWVSSTTAQQQTNDAIQAKVDRVLAPYCADRFMANKAAVAKFVKAGEGYDRNEIVQNTISKLGSIGVDYQLSANCANVIQAQLKKAPQTIVQGSGKNS